MVDMRSKLALGDLLKMKGRPRGGGKPSIEQQVGTQLHRASGRWRQIVRIIDRRNDRYVETIQDDGIAVRDVDVPLSEHRGHGDDRSQPKAHP
jgi:hypothetical protein